MLRRLTLVVTHRCNLKCDYCYAQGGGYGERMLSMSPSMAVAVLEHFLRNFRNVEEVFFFGGEPVLALETVCAVIELLCKLVSKGILPQLPKLTLATNGTLLPAELMNLCKRCDLRLTISIDGPPEIHDRHRQYACGGGTHRRVMNTLDQLRSSGIPFAAECTYTLDHWSSGYTPLSIYTYLKELGATNIAITEQMQDGGRTPFHFGRLSEEYLPAAVELMRYVCTEFISTGMIYYSDLKTLCDSVVNRPEILRTSFCGAGIDVFAVNPLGDVYPCHMFNGVHEFSLGHYKTAGLRSRRMPRKASFTSCRSCSLKEFCRACPAKMQSSQSKIILEPVIEDCKFKQVFACVASPYILRFIQENRT